MRTVDDIFDGIREPALRLMDNHNIGAVVALLDAFCVEAGYAVFNAIAPSPPEPALYSVKPAAWEKMRASRRKTVILKGVPDVETEHEG